MEALEDLDIKQNWTIYCLIDLKVVYIITYAYISIVNLISSTANSEATDDKQSMMPFDVSEEYTNVTVSDINDAILWNCRDRSLSIFYYRSLYFMALIALAAALIGFCTTKIFTSCGICISSPKYGLNMLWQIAVLQYVNNKMDTNNLEEKNEVLKMLNDEIPEGAYEGALKTMRCKMIILWILPFLLILIMASSYLTYDVHPLACLALSSQESIEYEGTKVTIKVPYGLFIYQTVAAFFSLLFIGVFLFFAYLFYFCTNQIVDTLNDSVDAKAKHTLTEDDENKRQKE